MELKLVLGLATDSSPLTSWTSHKILNCMYLGIYALTMPAWPFSHATSIGVLLASWYHFAIAEQLASHRNRKLNISVCPNRRQYASEFKGMSCMVVMGSSICNKGTTYIFLSYFIYLSNIFETWNKLPWSIDASISAFTWGLLAAFGIYLQMHIPILI